MNIWITSRKSFLGDALNNHFSRINVYATDREGVDMLNESQVGAFIYDNNIDVIFHTAVEGGKKDRLESPKTFCNNICMFENLAKYRKEYKLMINFGSGAESDRTKNIMEKTEEFFLDGAALPRDFYGFSKYVIANRIRGINANIINFRIFNIFGETEEPNRMVKSNIVKNLNGMPFEIHQERIMDFFSINDLFKVLEYYIKNLAEKDLYKDLNLCYAEKVSLTDICEEIEKNGKKTNVEYDKKGCAAAYCGSSKKIDSLDIKFLGLEKSIKNMYERVKRGL
ncbi:MAG TPA: NAD-dependent epimerase/dehydratase family protein [Nitrospinaceae bacterium]|nr:NAD-dependent epimerase/dehydratase family protein [Nitrospinaceae bacterium]